MLLPVFYETKSLLEWRYRLLPVHKNYSVMLKHNKHKAFLKSHFTNAFGDLYVNNGHLLTTSTYYTDH
jgi:hypothetical protein